MAANDPTDPDLLRLNAMVDGELTPRERAEVAIWLAADRRRARAHATLAELKAAIGTLGDDAPDLSGSLPAAARYRPFWRQAAAATAGLAVAALLIVSLPERPAPRPDIANSDVTAISYPDLPPGTFIPHFDMAGLKLIGVAIENLSDTKAMVASYLGPHGCRLDLRAWPARVAGPQTPGTARRSWQVGDVRYELVAHGMPDGRFSLIAAAAEWQTRQIDDPRKIRNYLREAGLNPPPCLG